MENPIKIDDLGFFPLFLETPISWGSKSVLGMRFSTRTDQLLENSVRSLLDCCKKLVND